MQTITVSRNDEIYEAFADVAQAADGTLVCTYRESMGHSSRPFSRIIVRRSFDRGLTWGPRQVVVERTEEEPPKGWDGSTARASPPAATGLCCSSLTYCSRIPLQNT